LAQVLLLLQLPNPPYAVEDPLPPMLMSAPSWFSSVLLTLLSPTAAAVSHNLLGRTHLGTLARSRLFTHHGGDASKASHPEHGHLTLKGLYPWYHNSEELRSAAARLSSDCSGALSLRTVTDSNVSIDVVRVRAAGSRPVNRVFIIFGEHSRELISPESGLYFLQVLCGKAIADGGPTATDVLKDSEFEMVLNGNPRSRRVVESGNFCMRANPDGVDLNRNWDEQWHAGAGREVVGTNPGPHPFSEPETRLFRQLVTEYQPTTFLTVHSGTRGLYMPWAYDTTHIASRNQGAMLQILKGVDQDHCQCPYGAAGKEVGYSCPGTCLDWVYDQLQTPYSFAFEIYTSPELDGQLRQRWEEKVRTGGADLLQGGHHLGHPHFIDLFQKHTSDFVHTTSVRSHSNASTRTCFGTFNPDTLERFNATLRNWAAAYLEMAQMVVVDLRSNVTVHAAS